MTLRKVTTILLSLKLPVEVRLYINLHIHYANLVMLVRLVSIYKPALKNIPKTGHLLKIILSSAG